MIMVNLGIGDTINRYLPTNISSLPILDNIKFLQVLILILQLLYLTSTLYCFGKNSYDPTVCSSNGFCIGNNICSCFPTIYWKQLSNIQFVLVRMQQIQLFVYQEEIVLHQTLVVVFQVIQVVTVKYQIVLEYLHQIQVCVLVMEIVLV